MQLGDRVSEEETEPEIAQARKVAEAPSQPPVRGGGVTRQAFASSAPTQSASAPKRSRVG